MSTVGLVSLLLAFVAAALSAVAFACGYALRERASSAEALTWGGHVATIVSAVALTVSCGVLVVCFLTDNYNVQYVLEQHSRSDNLLYRLSGLWAGRQGSLLVWAWMIGAFNATVSVRRMGKAQALDSMAVMVAQLVLTAFTGVLLFSEDNIPFVATTEEFVSSYGGIVSAVSMLGMNSLLEHWAMAIHPPTLFAGYAGLTIPFAYAIGACIVNDPSGAWVERSERYALFSWLFLTIGIGLGAVWAYVVLGWGGYWGWDPVENASLLAWLVCVALIHSLSLCRQRGMFKRWAVMCASLAFSFCVVGTFISRSGLVQSVHAFEGDPVSLALFGALILLSVLVGLAGCIVRRKSFASPADDFASMATKDGAHFINNLVMVVLALLLAYLTLSSALPSFLPFGGESVAAGTYNAIARPIGIAYLLMMAACPLLSWGKPDWRAFGRKARVPGACAVVLFALLMVYFATTLVPAYDAIVAADGTALSLEARVNPLISVVWAGFALLCLGMLLSTVGRRRAKPAGWR